ncbi:MAG: hypothetical protein HZA50_10415 [Planctomycetes bacterium]|nr:hypothetical protein [Planctomycetota bacterium]
MKKGEKWQKAGKTECVESIQIKIDDRMTFRPISPLKKAMFVAWPSWPRVPQASRLRKTKEK